MNEKTIRAKNKLKVSVVLPCLNEEDTLGECIKKIQNYFKEGDINGEIIVVDNGSTDDSPNIARRLKVKLVQENKRGYGNAYKRGFDEAVGE